MSILFINVVERCAGKLFLCCADVAVETRSVIRFSLWVVRRSVMFG